MSAAVETFRDDLEATYAVDFSRDREPKPARKRFPEYRRKGGAPTRVSGMHCRRSKRWTWGSGRGARMLNAKAFAGGLMLAIGSLLSGAVAQGDQISAQGLTIDAVLVAGGPSSPASGAGYGIVASNFLMGTTEVTNAQYAAFLTATGTANGTFNASMAITGTNGTYTANTGFENRPVDFVNYYSAARFVNWLVSGNTETGAYALNGSNVVVARTPGAPIFLPSVDEWYKAAYFNPGSSSWNTWAVNGTPVNGNPPGGSTTANFGGTGAVGATTNVGAYTSATSAYGTFDQLGNLTEILDTVAGPGQILRTGGNWNNPTLSTSSTVLNPTDPAFLSNQIGFRVAAVPEPSTFALAGVAISGLAGYEWSRRRKLKAALAG